MKKLIIVSLILLSSCLKKPTTSTVEDIPYINLPQVGPEIASLSQTLNGNEYKSGSIRFGNAGLGSFYGPITGVSSNTAVSIDSIDCESMMTSGDVCTMQYSIRGYLITVPDLQVTVKLQSDTYSSTAFTLNLAKASAISCPTGYHSDKSMCVLSLNKTPLLVSAVKTDNSYCLARVDSLDKGLSCILSPIDGQPVLYMASGIFYDDRSSLNGDSASYYVMAGEGLYKIKNGETYPSLVNSRITYLSEPMPSQVLHFNNYSVISGLIDLTTSIALIDSSGTIHSKITGFTMDYLMSKDNKILLYDDESQYYVLDTATSQPLKLNFPYSNFIPQGFITDDLMMFKSSVTEDRYTYSFLTGTLQSIKTLSNTELFANFGDASFNSGNSYIEAKSSIVQTDFFLFKNKYVIYTAKISKNDGTYINGGSWATTVLESKNLIYGVDINTNEIVLFLSLDSKYDGSEYHNYTQNSVVYSIDHLYYSYNHYTQVNTPTQFTKTIDTVYKIYDIPDRDLAPILSKSMDLIDLEINTISLSSVGKYSCVYETTYQNGLKSKSYLNDNATYNIMYNYKFSNNAYSDTYKVSNFNNTNAIVYESANIIYKNFTLIGTVNSSANTVYFKQDLYQHYYSIQEINSSYVVVKNEVYKINNDGTFSIISIPSGFSYIDLLN